MAKFLIKKKSKVHGTGIFTTKNIKKGSEFYKIPLDCIFHESKPKCAFIGNNTWVSDKGILNYVNHSCNPNTILDISNKPLLISKRNIKKGEEITVDYNKTELKGSKVLCNCRDDNCRKYFLRLT